MSLREQLTGLYLQKSKHSNYQILPSSLRVILNNDDIQVSSRYEKERLDYIKNAIDFTGKSVVDIGANTGYFSFELLDSGIRNMVCYEGNREHTEFISLAARVLGLDDKITAVNAYYEFDGSDATRYDVGLLFNVLHHIGDDYGDDHLTIERAKGVILDQLNTMALVVDTLVFQLGFNWQGDRTKPLFETGTKAEMIDFVRSGVDEYWDTQRIGIAEGVKGDIIYRDLNDKNIERVDSLGEFLNRPIFILKSKVYNGEKS